MSDLFDFSPQKKMFAVMGNPIKHSRSPYIHSLFATQTGIKLEYTAIHVELGGFKAAVRNFHANGGSGLNITVPFKLEAFELADRSSERATSAGAVNTLILLKDGDIEGDNTDGIGLVRDLEQNLATPLAGKRILLLGAGGAARGTLLPLLQQQPGELVIGNRSVDKAVALARDFSNIGPVSASAYSNLQGAFDIIINATSASLNGEVPPMPDTVIGPHCLAYDMVYAPQPTAFMRWAQSHGCEAQVDGLGMLVEQAAESFRIWNGAMPDTAAVLRQLKKEL